MKKLTILILTACAMQAGALTIEADAPTKLSNGANIPADHLSDLRGTLYSKPSSGIVTAAQGYCSATALKRMDGI